MVRLRRFSSGRSAESFAAENFRSWVGCPCDDAGTLGRGGHLSGAWSGPARGYRARDLLHLGDGRRVAAPGILLVRHKPGAARGVMFITIEDETGVANLVLGRTGSRLSGGWFCRRE